MNVLYILHINSLTYVCNYFLLVRCHLTPVRMAHIRKNMKSLQGWGCSKKGTLHALLVEIMSSSALMESILETLQKLRIELPYNPQLHCLVSTHKKLNIHSKR